MRTGLVGNSWAFAAVLHNAKAPTASATSHWRLEVYVMAKF
jgi:hypothetical protein